MREQWSRGVAIGFVADVIGEDVIGENCLELPWVISSSEVYVGARGLVSTPVKSSYPAVPRRKKTPGEIKHILSAGLPRYA
eukprot:scaffold375600_cov28-Prasinocladus_malaysianus.AAC.2